MSHRVGDGSVLIDEEIYHRTVSSFEILVSESACLQNITYDKVAAFQSENNCRLLLWICLANRVSNFAEVKGIIEIFEDFWTPPLFNIQY